MSAEEINAANLNDNTMKVCFENTVSKLHYPYRHYSYLAISSILLMPLHFPMEDHSESHSTLITGFWDH